MKRTIDDVSADLTTELTLSPLEKTLPPKLLYRFRRWMQKFHGPKAKVAHTEVKKAMDQMSALKSLKKNEMIASMYDNGDIRLDFGGAVDSKVKDAAMKWAKKRGLKAIEASLDKSKDAPSYVIMSGEDKTPRGNPSKIVKYTV